MSRIDSTAHRARRTKGGGGIRHPASPVSACTTFFRAEPIERIGLIRKGILASDAKRILSDLAVTRAVAMSALNISVATMNRRVKGKGRLPPAESERVLGLARLVGQVQNIVEQSGSAESFDATPWMARWLSEPLPALGGVRPLDLLDTMEGQALVSRFLARIQSGTYA